MQFAIQTQTRKLSAKTKVSTLIREKKKKQNLESPQLNIHHDLEV